MSKGVKLFSNRNLVHDSFYITYAFLMTTATITFIEVGFNVLDLFSKCFVGIFFWAYFTKVFSL